MPIGPGSTLLHYRIVDKIGEGGMGVVWRAQDARLDRSVALKILPPEWAADPERLERFERESKVVASLNHPNVVTLYAVERDGDLRFITMELVEGRQLADEIAAGPMSVERFLDLAVPMADAIAAAHASGVTHRDLKPTNILLTPEGRPKVLDFGLAKRNDPARMPDDATIDSAEAPTVAWTQAGKLLGTVPYMSPEQVKGRPVDFRTDIFSLGVVFYEMLTGRRPFAGEDTAELISSILRDRPDAVRDSAPGVPLELERILARALDKDPERRHASAAALRDELERLRRAWQSGEISVSGLEAVAARTRRSRTALLVAVVAVAAVGIGYLLWPRDGDGDADGGDAARGGRGGAAADRARALPAAAEGDAEAIPSVAVLPFANVSPEPDAEYFADGMTEELISALSRVPGLRVAARTSVFALRGRDLTVAEIAEELGVEQVLEGSVRKDGDRLRVGAQLVDATNGFPLWSETFDRTVDDVFAIQEEIARSIVEKLRGRWDAPADLADQGTRDADAYQLYLKGRYAWNQRNEKSLRKAIDLFERSIEEDPEFALAWAGLADSWAVLPSYAEADREQAMAEARTAAERAVELGPRLAEAHTSLAAVLGNVGKLEEAEVHYRKALELNPNYATARHWLGTLYHGTERPDAALAELQQAEELDPISRAIKLSLADSLSDIGDLDAALEKLVELRELDPDFPVGHRLARAHYARRMFRECREDFDALGPREALEPADLRLLALCLHYSERYEEELEVARLLREKVPRSWDAVRLAGQAHARLGDGERAIALVEEGIESHGFSGMQDVVPVYRLMQELRLAGEQAAAQQLARTMLAWRDEADVRDLPAVDVLIAYFRYVTGNERGARAMFDGFEPVVRANPSVMAPEVFLGLSGGLAAVTGDRAGAQARLDELRRIERPTYRGADLFWQGTIHAALGDRSTAVALARAAFAAGYPEFEDLLHTPFFESLRDDPGYRVLLRELNLPMPETRRAAE